jgi:ketosteroid isomerase-like protein
MSSITTVEQSAELAAANREVASKILALLGTEEQFEYYADDVVIEFPYASSLGESQPERVETKPVVTEYVRRLWALGLKMRDAVYYSVAGDPATVFIEYVSDVRTPGGGTYLQVYVNKMTFRDGKMTHMREFWDPKRILDGAAGVYDTAAAA